MKMNRERRKEKESKKKKCKQDDWGKKILQKYPSKHGVKKVKEIQQKHKNKKNIQKRWYIYIFRKLIFNS